MIPEISVEQLAEKIKSTDQFILLDVREPDEIQRARIDDARLAVTPMSEIARQGLKRLPEEARQKEAEVFVMCHMGERSANVTGWLRKQGWTNVYSVAGGIDAYARRVDPAVGEY